jgi:hypothetical protein
MLSHLHLRTFEPQLQPRSEHNTSKVASVNTGVILQFLKRSLYSRARHRLTSPLLSLSPELRNEIHLYMFSGNIIGVGWLQDCLCRFSIPVQKPGGQLLSILPRGHHGRRHDCDTFGGGTSGPWKLVMTQRINIQSNSLLTTMRASPNPVQPRPHHPYNFACPFSVCVLLYSCTKSHATSAYGFIISP